MGAPNMKLITFLTLVALMGFIAGPNGAYGAQVCGTLTVERAAWKLGPCELAAKAGNVKVSSTCCKQLRNMIHNPRCLCAVALSETARRVGVLPKIALAVIKRCGITNRPVGSTCGRTSNCTVLHVHV
ncbi:Bifunctional inhibitor/plant lipid transfer protein/seed storage helical domain containing protein [Trema orientale]|uniref:Bifunctional inhibitor/plant lipid transfer protein/seed storage helical domain containing protein n=1 Tax=Trema orientale TaxID=63057 RepID=A0A2P5EQ29_TREOI|nr:Bifunctional inhibitor/plant lipid transfer protein/seed storage helical domain containing protein [Trema orientale]